MPLTPSPLPSSPRIAIIGLGYVGLPLAVAFGQHHATVGFDVSAARIAQLQQGLDASAEVDAQELAAAGRLRFSADEADLAACNVFIVAVPTPVDAAARPDLGPLEAASALVGRHLRAGGLVIYESTVYPGCTEEVCVPVLERASGLRFNEGFFVGYSPERVNPGDRQRRLADVVKVTSGSTPECAAYVDALYRQIIRAGTHPVGSLRVAEAAKVIENIQRDVNIALVNELAILFERLGLDSREVLDAAGTKWNFLPFRPGLVGGHCIGVDPYYLTYKAQQLGYHPEMILAGRRINDGMGEHVAMRVLRLLSRRGFAPRGARVLVLGVTFKENCPDIRNTKVLDIVHILRDFGAQVQVHDPVADAAQVLHEYGEPLASTLPAGPWDALVLAVAHEPFCRMAPEQVQQLLAPGGVVFDVKSVWPREWVDERL